MRRFLLAVAACLGLTVAPTAPAFAWSVKEMNATIDQTNFLVNRGCSGTLIDKANGYILTAHHCITDQFETIEREKIDSDGVVKKEKVRITRPGTVSQLTFQNASEVQRSVYAFKVKLSDKDLDLALIQVIAKLPNTIEAKIACTDVSRGDVVYAVGNPLGVLYSSVTKGIVSSINRNYPMLGIDDQGDHQLLQISSGIIGGNSGGAAYNDSGELIGVPVRGSRVNEIIGLAAPLGDIKKLLMREGLHTLWAHCEVK